MPAKSPADITDPTLSIVINVNGSPIKDYYPLLSIDVTHEVDRISTAEIVIIDGSVDVTDFPISASDDFVPGTPIEIFAGYGSDARNSIFKGLITKQGIRIEPDEASQLIITCKHKAVSMTFNRTEQYFSKKLDSDVISSIVGNYGLSATVKATGVTQEMVVQKLATDWDFILSRTAFYGYIITTDGDDLVIGAPEVSGTPVLRVAWGESLISFDAELDAERQPPSLEAMGWDIKNQALLKSSASEPSVNEQGNLAGKDFSAKLGQEKLSLSSNTPMEQDELKAWADGRLLRLRLAAITGSIKFQGSSLAMPGKLIELDGVGARFNGNAFLSSVTHHIIEGEWYTVAELGLRDDMVHEAEGYSYPMAAGQLPGVHGLQVGTVKAISKDPASEFRIQVTLYSNSTAQDGIWARMANFYASKGFGSGFFPEVGDEVIIGFLESNPRYPVVLGSLYSSGRDTPNPQADDKNNIKSLVTRSKIKMSFDDDKKIFKIETPGANSITISDDAKSIEIVDQNGNSLKMTSSGIDLETGKDITLKATGNINLKATGKVDIQATQDAAIKGMNVTATADIGFTAKGNATAEVSASGQTTLKGGIVMIN